MKKSLSFCENCNKRPFALMSYTNIMMDQGTRRPGDQGTGIAHCSLLTACCFGFSGIFLATGNQVKV
jgi:hypothetical protein